MAKTKKEMYEELEVLGVALDPIEKYTADDLSLLLEESAVPEGDDTSDPGNTVDDTDGEGTGDAGDEDGDDTSDTDDDDPDGYDTEDEELPEVLLLTFKEHGWCEELKSSYHQGVYHCKSVEEYQALKKYAV